MARAVIYARFSSDLQKDRSIDDQIAVCQAVAKRENLTVVEIFSDRAKSGASMFDRDGLLDLMKKAKEHRFTVLIVESLDRLSRDQEDLAGLFKRLSYNDIEIHTVNEGVTTSLHVGLRGIIGSMFLKDLGNKVKRGQSGLAREGKVPGSIPYGYRYVLGKKGEPEINPEQAAIVRRIYADYVAGIPPHVIAKTLTHEKVLAPGGGRWSTPTISGGGPGRFGILTNPIYVGQLVWNKTRRVINPDTGRKIRRISAEDQTTSDVPHLRIIKQPTWEAAKALRENRARHHFGPNGAKIRRMLPFVPHAEHLLTGVLRCSECGGHMRIRSMTRGTPWAACATADAHDLCPHKRTYDLDRLQKAILDGMREHLTDPEAIVRAARGFHLEWAERSKKNRGDAASLRKALNRVQIKMDRLVHALTDSDTPVEQITPQFKPLEMERVSLTERLRLIEAETNVVDLHPGVIDAYVANVEKLHKSLAESPTAPENRAAFRNLISHIVIHPTGKRMPYEFTPYGRLGAIMGIDLFPSARTMTEMLAEQGVTSCDESGDPNRDVSSSHYGKLVPLGRWRSAA